MWGVIMPDGYIELADEHFIGGLKKAKVVLKPKFSKAMGMKLCDILILPHPERVNRYQIHARESAVPGY